MAVILNENIYIIGIAVRTTNENGQSGIDIPQLWSKFVSEQTAAKITGKTSNDIYSVYTEYEKDFTKPYTTVLGCRVEENTAAPEGFKKIIIPPGKYQLYTAKGDLDNAVVYSEWTAIWNSSLKRAYTADYEVYGEKAKNPANAEVDIFVAIE
jgi:predicted transcriptional regulator YdeE